MKKFRYIAFMLFGALVALTAFTSCSESSDDTDNDFVDWQNRNEVYFNNVREKAEQAIKSGSEDWKILNKWSVNVGVAKPTDQIVVNVLQKGTGLVTPLFTDNVFVFYRGRLIPSVNYPEGFVFDQSFVGKEFNPETASPSIFLVSSLTDGFSSAIQNMHEGDYWRVYVPYQLGYGTTDSGKIPAFSTLIFDVYLYAICKDSTFPSWHAKEYLWQEEE